jgi:hypothetical protein
MMCAMSEEIEQEIEQEIVQPPDGDGAGVLANLPRSRPQRSSARRIAARESSDRAGGASRRAPASARAKASSGSPRTTVKTEKATPKAARGSTGNGAARARPGPAPRSRPKVATARSDSAKSANRAPRQGFESDAESTSGPVAPPGSAEFLNAATELLAVVARSGLSRGSATLREIMERLRIG